MKMLLPERVINVHISYLPLPKHLGEPKTKPTQESVRVLMSMGIQPDFLILRSEVDLDERRRYLLGLKISVKGECIIMAKDMSTIYELPLSFYKQEFDKKVLKKFRLRKKTINVSDIKRLVGRIEKKQKKSTEIAIVGKYFTKNKGDFALSDAYYALLESINHAGWNLGIDINVRYVNSVELEEKGAKKMLRGVKGIIVPIGWGKRGVEGKIEAIEYARKKKIPYLGLCLGMQMAAVEFARNVMSYKGAHSTEMDPGTKYPVIHDIPVSEKYQIIKSKGTTMRLGGFDCVVKKGTLAYKIYSKNGYGKKDSKGNLIVSERHRHRFEFNNMYREDFHKNGFIISGTSPDDFFVELIELPRKKHPFFIATQAHPEYKSRPLEPHPLFLEFVKATMK
jgi:CTP synthase